MGTKKNNLLNFPWATALLYGVVRAYYRTLRIRVENEEPWMAHFKGGGKVIFCVWHQQLFAAIKQCIRYGRYRPSVMISKSRDGELIAGFMESIGWIAARGSSSRGGGRALKEMIERLGETRFAGHILDGPRGPMGKVKTGVIHLAQAADSVLVPLRVTVDNAWYLKSWDRFMLPKPFSMITLRFCDMIRLAATEDPEEMEKQRQDLENIMKPFLIIPDF